MAIGDACPPGSRSSSTVRCAVQGKDEPQGASWGSTHFPYHPVWWTVEAIAIGGVRLAKGCDGQCPELEKTRSVFEPEQEKNEVLRGSWSGGTGCCAPVKLRAPEVGALVLQLPVARV